MAAVFLGSKALGSKQERLTENYDGNLRERSWWLRLEWSRGRKNAWSLIYFNVELAWFYDGLNVVGFCFVFFCSLIKDFRAKYFFFPEKLEGRIFHELK